MPWRDQVLMNDGANSSELPRFCMPSYGSREMMNNFTQLTEETALQTWLKIEVVIEKGRRF